jgi:hypothetical protein
MIYFVDQILPFFSAFRFEVNLFLPIGNSTATLQNPRGGWRCLVRRIEMGVLDNGMPFLTQAGLPSRETRTMTFQCHFQWRYVIMQCLKGSLALFAALFSRAALSPSPTPN